MYTVQITTTNIETRGTYTADFNFESRTDARKFFNRNVKNFQTLNDARRFTAELVRIHTDTGHIIRAQFIKFGTPLNCELLG